MRKLEVPYSKAPKPFGYQLACLLMWMKAIYSGESSLQGWDMIERKGCFDMAKVVLAVRNRYTYCLVCNAPGLSV